jgi:hypothetical protein
MTIAAALALAACGGARTAPEPIYELRATEAPLRYGLEATQRTVVELPTGDEQEIQTSMSALLTLSYGEATPDGLPFVLTIDELEAAMPGAPGADLSAIIGEPIRGVMGSEGDVSVDEAPQIDVPGFDAASLAELIGPLMIPLPPDGDAEAESWPLERSRAVGGGLSGTSRFDGTVSFTPETEWRGAAARILVAAGHLRQRASGQPPGAPGEVDVDLEGESTTTYAWDPIRGVVLHVNRVVELEGALSMQGMALPMTTNADQTFDLQP